MRAGIIPHDDDAIAGRAAMLNQWGFIVGGAAATRAIRFFCQENGLAITTHRHAAGRAEALRRVELGATRRAGDHIDTYFPGQQGMQNTHGMARQHKPQHGGWLRDARKARESLLKWLGDTVATQVPAAASPRLAAPPLAKTQPEPGSEEGSALDEFASLLEEDWPWWNDVRNRRAILVGGVPKEPSRLRMEQAFQFAELAWVDGDVRKVNSVTERIQHGGLDLVLIVRAFISHKVAKKVQFACKNYKVPCVFIERGHGVVAVRYSIERYLAQSA